MRVDRTITIGFNNPPRAVLYLALWCLFITAVVLLAPQPSPMKAYRPHGVWAYGALAVAPFGAWHAARYGGHPIVFLLYGALCTALFDLAWAFSLPFWATDSDYVNRAVACIALPVAMGLLCRWVATSRIDMAEETARRGEYCANCEYNLRGNVSGICPECGTSIPWARTEDSSELDALS